jgi:hypothetical protein
MAARVTVPLDNLVSVSAFLAYSHVISQILAIHLKAVRRFDLAPAIRLQVSPRSTLSALGIGFAQQAIGLAQEARASTEIVSILTELTKRIVAIAIEAVSFGTADTSRWEQTIISGTSLTALHIHLTLDAMQVLTGYTQVIHIPVSVLALEALARCAVCLAPDLVALDAIAIGQLVVAVRPLEITLWAVPCYASHHLARLDIGHALVVH